MTALNLRQMDEVAEVKVEHLWGPSICKGYLVMIRGDTGVGKTRFCLDLAFAIASSSKYLRWHCERPTPCYYYDAEVGIGRFKSRYLEAKERCPVDLKGGDIHICSFDTCVDASGEPRKRYITEPEDQRWFDSELARTGAKVFFIDNFLTSLHFRDGRDNEFSQWPRIQKWFERLRTEGFTVILVHHNNSSGSGYGSMLKRVILDSEIELKAPPATKLTSGAEFEVHFRKARDFSKADAPPMRVEYIKGEDGLYRWNWGDLHQDIKSRVAKLQALGLNIREAAKELGMTISEVYPLWT